MMDLKETTMTWGHMVLLYWKAGKLNILSLKDRRAGIFLTPERSAMQYDPILNRKTQILSKMNLMAVTPVSLLF